MLRPSQEWLGHEWKSIRERPDTIPSILSRFESRQHSLVEKKKKPSPVSDMSGNGSPSSVLEPLNDNGRDLYKISNLLKDDAFAQLKWKSHGKRKRNGGNSDSPVSKRRSTEFKLTNIFQMPLSLKMDKENCKYIEDSVYSSGSPFSSLVMSR